MGNKQSLSQADVQAMETGDRHLGKIKDPVVKKMAKRLEAMKQDVLTKGPPDVKELFDQLAEDGKISKANFSILMRGSLNFAVKNALCSQGGGPALHASKKDAIANIEMQVEQTGAFQAVGLDSLSIIASLVKAMDRLDLHSTQILDRAFGVLDTDGSGFLDFSEIEAFIGKLMSDPMSAVDPFAFISGSGADKVSIDEVSELLCDIFAFLADMQVQVFDVLEDVFTSHDVQRSIESDTVIWTQFFGLAGGDDKITMKQFKAFLAHAPWEAINGEFMKQMTTPHFAAMMAHNTSQLAELKEGLLSGISETGSAEAGMARAYAWLKNGIDETTFMSSVLPSFRKFVKEKMEPKELAKNYAKTVGLALKDVKDPTMVSSYPPEARQQLELAGPILDMIAAQVSQEGFLEGIFTQPAVSAVIEKYAAAYQTKLPIILHQAFRFCDINSDGGVSESELKVLFALKDAIANGKIDEAAVHIFEVLDKDGNGELSPGEVMSFLTKCLSLFTACQRIVVSLVFETLLPEITKIALPMVAAAAGFTEISKEQLPGLLMMAQAGLAGMQESVDLSVVCYLDAQEGPHY